MHRSGEAVAFHVEGLGIVQGIAWGPDRELWTTFVQTTLAFPYDFFVVEDWRLMSVQQP